MGIARSNGSIARKSGSLFFAFRDATFQMTARRLTLIAGSGALAPLMAAAARRSGDMLQVIDLGGRGDIAGDRIETIPLSEAPRLIAAVRSFDTTHLVLAG